MRGKSFAGSGGDAKLISTNFIDKSGRRIFVICHMAVGVSAAPLTGRRSSGVIFGIKMPRGAIKEIIFAPNGQNLTSAYLYIFFIDNIVISS
jgi:hypothetical protein